MAPLQNNHDLIRLISQRPALTFADGDYLHHRVCSIPDEASGEQKCQLLEMVRDSDEGIRQKAAAATA